MKLKCLFGFHNWAMLRREDPVPLICLQCKKEKSIPIKELSFRDIDRIVENGRMLKQIYDAFEKFGLLEE